MNLSDIGPVALVGAGKMGLALARGWIAGGLPADRLVLCDPKPGEAAVQFAADGIRVNSVHPGILPPMRTSRLTADPAHRARMLKGVPMKREGRVEEVAYAVLFLASDEASYITGTELVVDGGYLAV